MQRNHYRLFSPGRIGTLELSNRLVRSATWDPSILPDRKMKSEVLSLYAELAAGGVGMIITGDFSVVPAGALSGANPSDRRYTYEDMRIEGFGGLAEAVHNTSPACRIVAQVSGDYPGIDPSENPSPYMPEHTRALSADEIRLIVSCFVEAIAGVKGDGFDGVELHAAHGGLLSRFLSPYSNRRGDLFGGSIHSRARIIREIVTGARERVGDFPILIKMNCTDYIEGGIDIDSFPALAREIADSGVTSIEVSGGMWDCLVRTEEELGFRPVPAAESHTRIRQPDRQSYFLGYAEKLDFDIPVILGGGNRDVDRLEAIVQSGKVDFISMCRPLISEPGLPRRWLEGRGSSGTDCISCNSCLYDMYTRVDKGTPGVATCILKHNMEDFRTAQRWLASWVSEHATH